MVTDAAKRVYIRRAVPPLRIVVVDDEPMFLELTRERLRNQRELEIVGVASNGVEGIELIRELRPDAAVIDVFMPQMNGFEVIAALRQNILTRDIPVVMCSIEAISKIEDQALSAGASDFLQKPVLRQDLVATVQRWAGTPVVVGAR